MARMYLKKGRSIVFVIIMLLSVVLIFGCSGSKGDKGDTGATGKTGETGPAGPAGPVTTTSESCSVCHTAGAIADIAKIHLPSAADDVKITVTGVQNVGGYPVVSFSVATKDGGIPITNLSMANTTPFTVWFAIADLVPANTPAGYLTATPPVNWGTWPTSYFERWANESNGVGSHAPQTAGTLTQTSPGNYTYTFATAFADASANGAPQFNPTDDQRIMIAIGGQEDTTDSVLTNNASGFLDFSWTQSDLDTSGNIVDGATATNSLPQRMFVTADTCKKCHGPLFQKAAHADEYLDTRACVICHSPLGPYASIMQSDDAYLSAFIHRIHSAINTGSFTFSDIKYPQNVEDCVVCHSNPDNMALADPSMISNWKTHPTSAVCQSCHTDVDANTGLNHPPGPKPDSQCSTCHPATGWAPPYTFGVADAHNTAADSAANPNPANIPEFKVGLYIAPPANGSYYVAGEAPVVAVTLEEYDSKTGDYDLDFNNYTTPQDKAGVSGGGLAVAALYVYGPRAKAVPVLATGTVTDPNFDASTDTPTQGHNLFVGGTDPQVRTSSLGFIYKLLPIPKGMTPGTYMVRVRIGDYDYISNSDYHIESYAFKTIQIGTATPSPKVAGDACINCHGTGTAPFHDARHAVPFDTDQCLSCHDQSGNHGDVLANRVHAVHDANTAGDLINIEAGGGTSRDWSDITYPQYISYPEEGNSDQTAFACTTCHNSGDTTWKTKPYEAPCAGCHVTINSPDDPVLNHMVQNGGPYYYVPSN